MSITANQISENLTRINKADTWRGVRDSLPVMVGFIPIALVLGAQASKKGLSIIEVSLMTALDFGGGSEFAAIGLWSSPIPILLITAMTFLINSRHLLMGAALAPLIRHLSNRQALIALFFMCDESWALGLSDAKRRADAGKMPPFSLSYYSAVATCLYLTWVTSSAVGAVLGPVMGDIETLGFDMAFPAVFLVLLKGMWQGKRTAIPWGASLLVAALTSLFVPGAWYVVTGSLAGLLFAFLGSKKT